MKRKILKIIILILICVPSFAQVNYSLPYHNATVYFTSGYGYRENVMREHTGGYKIWHDGIDLVGTNYLTDIPIYPMLDGVVTDFGYDEIYGNYVVTWCVVNNDWIKLLYGHFEVIDKNIFKGKSVDINTILGIQGSTGRSTGDHLHISVMVNGVITNPLVLFSDLEEREDVYVLE